ncbi:MAG TPA: SCO family protein [Burkholderiales bacterium]|nr:SCO family protein [Burkholderiales bacterium]
MITLSRPGPWLAVLLLVLAAGCSEPPPQFQSTDVTGMKLSGDFRLTDHNGKERTLSDFRGKAVVLFFGYTHCPDVCPTTMAELAAAMKQLGKDADRVQVLFVTVDPERDTADLLAKYVPSFNPGFLGLRGSPEATAKTAKDFKIMYQKQPGATPETYTVDHSAGTYVFDPQGRLRLYVSYGRGAEVFAHDIALLLRARG